MRGSRTPQPRRTNNSRSAADTTPLSEVLRRARTRRVPASATTNRGFANRAAAATSPVTQEQNHARNRLSAKSCRCSILEVGEPGGSARNGATTREILEVEPTLRVWLSYMRCRMANTRLPLVNVGMQITKKIFSELQLQLQLP